jgi:hypothetical protein
MRTILVAISFSFFVGCAADTTATDEALGEINCSSDAICAASYGGGVCREGLCRATNVCATTADCDAPQICVRSSVFHSGLCATPNTAPSPEPAATCNSTAANAFVCPPFEACGPLGQCHTRYCITDAQCPVGDQCHKLCGPQPQASSGPVQDPVGGICEPGNIQIVCPPDGTPTTPAGS